MLLEMHVFMRWMEGIGSLIEGHLPQTPILQAAPLLNVWEACLP